MNDFRIKKANVIKKLFKLFNLNKKKPNMKNKNLLKILSNQELISYVYYKLKYNKLISKVQTNKTHLNLIQCLSKKIEKQYFL